MKEKYLSVKEKFLNKVNKIHTPLDPLCNHIAHKMTLLRIAFVALFFTYTFTLGMNIVCDYVYIWPIRGILWILIAILGLWVTIGDFSMFKAKHGILLFLFLVSYLVSIIINSKYGFAGNCTDFVWMCSHLGIFYSLSAERNEKITNRVLNITGNIVIFIVSIGSISSFYQYINQRYYINYRGDLSRWGYFENYRFFGTLRDPNYSSVAMFAVIILAVYFIHKFKDKFLNIYYIGTIAFAYVYIITSLSRTGMVSLFVVTALFVFFVALHNKSVEKLDNNVVKFLVARIKKFNEKEHAIKKILNTVGKFVAARRKKSSKKQYDIQKILNSVVKFTVAFLIMAVITGANLFVFNTVKKGISYLPAVREDIMEFLGIESKYDKWKPEAVIEDPQVILERTEVEQSGNISSNRFKIWKASIDYIKLNPIFGSTSRNLYYIGQDNFPDNYIVQREYMLHNGYIELIVNSGIVGSIIMLAFFLLSAKDLLEYLIIRKGKYFAQVLCCTLCAIDVAVGAMFISGLVFRSVFTLCIFWVFLAIAQAFIGIEKKEEKEKILEIN